MIGVVPALLAAVGFSIFQTVNHRALRAVDVYRGTATLLFVGTVLLGAIAAATGGVELVLDAPLRALGICALAGFVHFFCGWTLLGISQVRLGASRTGVLIGTVPLFGAASAAVFLDEPLTPLAVAGLVLVVAGVTVVATRGGGARSARASGMRVGVAAGLGVALCWSISPVLLRSALRDLPSPLVCAAIGMAASAVTYGVAVVITGGRQRRGVIDERTWGLLAVASAAVSLAIWMQWTAFDLAPVALVLAWLQVTPLFVVALAVAFGGDVLDGPALRRVTLGAVVTVGGSLLVVLGG